MAHKPGDYSDFVIGEIYPDTLIRIESEVFKKLMANGKKMDRFVKYSCEACKSGKLWDGRIDRIRSGRTCRCPECGRRSKRPAGYTKDTWKVNAKTKATMNLNNLTGKHIGEIRGDWFINDVDHSNTTGHGHTYYKVINIKTGQIKVVRLDNLPHIIDNSFSCISDPLKHIPLSEKKKSTGEIAVAKWLTAHNIEFETEYSYDDLKGIGNGYLRFDVKIKNKNILIEFQGKEHYESIDHFGGQEGFKARQIHDSLKRIYCETHNYKLIEIPYDYKNLDDYLLDIT